MAVMPMSSSSQAPGHIEITETLLRLYVFLAQYLDRCQDDTIRKSFPESELQVHLSATRSRILEILSVNRVVKGKVEQECEPLPGSRLSDKPRAATRHRSWTGWNSCVEGGAHDSAEQDDRVERSAGGVFEPMADVVEKYQGRQLRGRQL
jgi:hypothetical protein